jgi:hypothetical protein
MDTKKARKKSFDVDYVEVTEANIEEVAVWCGGRVIGSDKDRYIKIIDKGALNERQTKAYLGDFVVHHARANTYRTFNKKNFWRTFEEIVASGQKVSHARDAGSGEYVSDEYAEEHPDTTVIETDTSGSETSVVEASDAGSDEQVDAPQDGVDPATLGSVLPRDAGLD